MTVSLIMDAHPLVLRDTDWIRDGVDYVMRHRYRNIPVLDGEGRYLGVFGVNCLLRLSLPNAAVMDNGLETLVFAEETLDDLYRRIRKHFDLPVASCIDRKVATVTPDTSMLEALLLLYRSRTSVPVVEPDSKHLMGMISYWDVGRAILDAGADDVGDAYRAAGDLSND